MRFETIISLMNSNTRVYTLYISIECCYSNLNIPDDWGPPVQPDLQTFVPYVWRFDFKFTDALIVLPVSQHNWVDCIQNKLENSETGELFLIRTSEMQLPAVMLCYTCYIDSFDYSTVRAPRTFIYINYCKIWKRLYQSWFICLRCINKMYIYRFIFLS